ncbi:MAG: hypothetical protein ACP5UQ_10995 [Anaerolineae bacterium]
MPDHKAGPMRFERTLVAEAIPVGERMLQPSARAAGWYAAAAGRGSAGAIGWVRLAPDEVVVREADGREHRLPMADPTGTILRQMCRAMAALTLVCWAIMAAAAAARMLRR